MLGGWNKLCDLLKLARPAEHSEKSNRCCTADDDHDLWYKEHRLILSHFPGTGQVVRTESKIPQV